MQIVVPDGASYVTQSEFNTAIALLACAQNKIGKSILNSYNKQTNVNSFFLDVSIDSLYRNRNCKNDDDDYYNYY